MVNYIHYMIAHQRYSIGYAYVLYLLRGEVVDVFHNAAQGVAVGHDEDVAAVPNGRQDAGAQQGQGPVHGVLQALGQRDVLRAQVRVLGLAAVPPRMVR
jgi:hypothetical protein